MDEADSLLQRALKSNPQDVDVMDAYAEFLQNEKKDAVAAEEMRKRSNLAKKDQEI